MNANELAGYLDNNVEAMLFTEQPYIDQAVTMLRQFGLAESIIKQQQAEIEALKKQLDTRTKELIGASFYEHDYKTMMANNEPVAWMLVDEINGDYMLERHPSGDYDWIPLYTHPVKDKPHPKCDEACMYLCQMRELTDEEIMEVATINLGHSMGLLNWMGFARAILRKAQEK